MARYRLALAQNLPHEKFSTANVHYTYDDGAEEDWLVIECEPKNDTVVVTVEIVGSLPRFDVLGGKLVCTYKNENGSRTEIFHISSVQLIDGPELAATLYTVRIFMPQETIERLTTGGFSLYGFKAVKTSVRDASPLVWFQTKRFGRDTDLSWEEKYEAYTSRTVIAEGVTITPDNSYRIDLGQTLEVTGANGTGIVYNRSTAGAIDILNRTGFRFTSGISQTPPGGGPATPMCAFDIYRDFINSVIPIAKVLLLFAAREVSTGTVIFSSYGPGILIDLSGVRERQVNYALDSGWTWGGGTWARGVAAGTSIQPLLINRL